MHGAPKAVVAANVPNDAAQVGFDGLGRLVFVDAGGQSRRPTVNDPTPTFDVSTSFSVPEQRLLRVVVDLQGGGVKRCDPKLPADDPGGCPEAVK